jgi:hypothetical protein
VSIIDQVSMVSPMAAGNYGHVAWISVSQGNDAKAAEVYIEIWQVG